jgi:hypothetical protein
LHPATCWTVNGCSPVTALTHPRICIWVGIGGGLPEAGIAATHDMTTKLAPTKPKRVERDLVLTPLFYSVSPLAATTHEGIAGGYFTLPAYPGTVAQSGTSGQGVTSGNTVVPDRGGFGGSCGLILRVGPRRASSFRAFRRGMRRTFACQPMRSTLRSPGTTSCSLGWRQEALGTWGPMSGGGRPSIVQGFHRFHPAGSSMPAFT